DRVGKLAALDFAANVVESGHDTFGLGGGEQADLSEHAGVGLAGDDVLAVEALVEADRLGKGFDTVVRGAAETTAPGLLTHGDFLGLAQASALARGSWLNEMAIGPAPSTASGPPARAPRSSGRGPSDSWGRQSRPECSRCGPASWPSGPLPGRCRRAVAPRT